MAGSSPTAVFANPHGLVFEIVTVRDADGVMLLDPAAHEHSWFPGYAWRVALCGGCSSHVGWSFHATAGQEPVLFFGLATRAITQQPEG
jgi:hypothetical protein